jgi:SAM-dependent methyltransferase
MNMTLNNKKKYRDIVTHYEKCLEEHGDNHLGVDWPKLEDVDKRYRVMTEIHTLGKIVKNRYSLLDFGCGAAHLLEYLKKNKFEIYDYSGLDISEKFVSLCRNKFPEINFYVLDILDEPSLPHFDYIIMNGVLTEKRDLNYDEMITYFRELIKTVFAKADLGIAFNVMSKHVDRERNDLFHLPFDDLASFLTKEVSRNFVIRNDYGLYEYTIYVYK